MTTWVENRQRVPTHIASHMLLPMNEYRQSYSTMSSFFTAFVGNSSPRTHMSYVQSYIEEVKKEGGSLNKRKSNRILMTHLLKTSNQEFKE